MQRIYQGRVKAVEIEGSDKQFGAVPFADGHRGNDQSSCPLWDHHSIFQDAINYYLFALGALAAEPEYSTSRVVGDLRHRLAAAWEEFPRADAQRRGARSLRDSLHPWLGLDGNASIDDAFRVVLAGNPASTEHLRQALELLLAKAKGDAAIQQAGRGYFPRFFWTGYKGSFDLSVESLEAGAGKERLAAVLHGEADQADLESIAGDLDLSWTVKVDPGKFFEGADARLRLRQALAHVAAMVETPSPRLAGWLKDLGCDAGGTIRSFLEKVDCLPEETKIPRNRKAAPDLKFATIAFKFFPHPVTRMCLRQGVKAPAKRAAAAASSPAAQAAGDDPVRMARGPRGYVFPAFTALPAWRPESPGEPSWKEFDIAAFKEALKALNQFKQKTEERQSRLDDLDGHIACLLGAPKAGWKPQKSEGDEEADTPEALPAESLALAFRLEAELTQMLSDQVLGEERTMRFGEASMPSRDGGWTITRAALRGFREIGSKWVAKHAENQTTRAQLEEIVREHQREEANARSVGSIPLFLALCREEYWKLWLPEEETDARDAEEETTTAEARPSKFLHEMAGLHDLVEEFLRSQEPVNLTPAEPTHSRRLFMFSDLMTEAQQKTNLPKAMELGQAEVLLALRSEGHVSKVRAWLHFTAPRIHRDELLGAAQSRWLQPMMAALGRHVVDAARPANKFALALMPDFDRDGNLRHLLNFPADLDTAPIHEALGRAAHWAGQFHGTKDKNLHLHWPGTPKTEAINRGKGPWWENPELRKTGFTLLANDLGQRTAGAWALLRVTASRPQTKRPVRLIGSAGGVEWYAEVVATGMHRLPGEDAGIGNPDGTTTREPSGKAGRNSDSLEWEEAKAIAGLLLATQPEAWVGAHRHEKSFPGQNDALLALAGRRLSRLATFHRWSCFDPERTEGGPRREAMVTTLKEELAHWQDEDVAGWAASIDSGDFASFRQAAGQAFVASRDTLAPVLVRIAGRVCPLRDASWEWRPRGDGTPYGDLTPTGGAPMKAPKVRGQRGLSMARIEQLENLRRLFLRYNRAMDREPGEPARFGRDDRGRASGEPCQHLLEKIDAMKEERVNQTAHMILAQALGVRLRAHDHCPAERNRRDPHGAYQRIPGREPVDFIIIENLDRYLTSQGRAPSENSRLMKWAHRAVRDKIKMLAEEPFGIQVVETAAAYSSRFCAFTSEAGARCEERAFLDPFLRKLLAKRAESRPDQRGLLNKLLRQFDLVEAINTPRDKASPPRSLLLPKPGGPLFLGLRSAPLRQADINAAINLGLRAVACPSALDLLHKIRTEKKADGCVPVLKNRREKTAFKAGTITLSGEPSKKLAQSRSPNFFVDPAGLAAFDRAEVTTTDGHPFRLASGVGLWAAVNEGFLGRVVGENTRRLRKWSLDPSAPPAAGAEPDDIPM